jgi:hypothetical protein
VARAGGPGQGFLAVRASACYIALMHNIQSVRFDEDTLKRIEAHAKRLADKTKMNVSFRGALQSLIETGLRESERKR